MKIDSNALPNAGIRIELDGKSEEMPAHIAGAFISRMLAQMQQQSEKIGDNTPEGGALIYPDSAAVEMDRETNEPRLRLGFGKVLFVVSMPKGALKELAKAIVAT